MREDKERSARFVMTLAVSIILGVIVTGAWENRVVQLEPEK